MILTPALMEEHVLKGTALRLAPVCLDSMVPTVKLTLVISACQVRALMEEHVRKELAPQYLATVCLDMVVLTVKKTLIISVC